MLIAKCQLLRIILFIFITSFLQKIFISGEKLPYKIKKYLYMLLIIIVIINTMVLSKVKYLVFFNIIFPFNILYIL